MAKESVFRYSTRSIPGKAELIAKSVVFFLSRYLGCYNTTSIVYVLAFWPQAMWDLSSPTRDQTCTPGIGR